MCVHVNHGLMRKGESEQVIDVFQNQMDANLVYVDATDRFLDLLADVDEPETKRKIIGGEFIRVFEEEARKVGDEVDFLAQGTIYPDILESTGRREGPPQRRRTAGGFAVRPGGARETAVQGRGARRRPRAGPARVHG